MSEDQVRRGWRGQAAGIPPARVLVPASALPSVPSPSEARRERHAGELAAPEPEDFPLWPTTSTVVLHEGPPATEPDGAERDEVAAGAAGAAHEVVAAHEAVTAHEVAAAHEAGRAAVADHLAGRPEQWPPPAMRLMRRPRDDRRSAPERRPRQRRVRAARGPVAGLSAMLVTALLTGFFAWTSAEPFWLDMGHRVRGTAEITSCKGSGVLRRCLAEFTRPGAEKVRGTRLMGLDEPAGSTVAAVMVPGGRVAYAGNPSGLRVRWAAGLGLIVLCGIVLAWLTGAWRFGRLRDRLTAWTLTAAAPLVLGAAIVVAAY